jgi:cell division protein FtsW
MAKMLSPDRTLFIVTMVLVSFGLVMVYSASAMVAHEAHRSSYFFLFKQIGFAALGLAVMSILMRMDYRWLNRPVVIYGLFAITVVLLIGVLFSPPLKNAHRWLRFGLMSFQPSEGAKLVLILTLAYQLEKRREKLDDFFGGLFPSLLVTGFLAFLVLIEPDFGTASCLVLIGCCVLFISGAPLRYLVQLGLVTMPLIYWLVIRVPYRRQRLLAFLDPFEDPLGRGFQIIQSFIALSTGGLFGVGFMRSRQKLFYLPEPHTDFVFSVIGEELGLIGTLVLVAAFSIFLWRGIVIAHRAPDLFGTLLAGGLTALIVGQAFLNIGVTLGLLPTTGIPLPFISAGGSSLVSSMAAVGLLLSVSQRAG